MERSTVFLFPYFTYENNQLASDVWGWHCGQLLSLVPTLFLDYYFLHWYAKFFCKYMVVHKSKALQNSQPVAVIDSSVCCINILGRTMKFCSRAVWRECLGLKLAFLKSCCSFKSNVIHYEIFVIASSSAKFF